jgi:hypothetical protein
MSSPEETLLELLEKAINRFQRESNKHKRLYRGLRYTAVGLTGCATVLASAALRFQDDTQLWLNLAVVGATTLAGIVTSIGGLRKPSELWIHERRILYDLIDLERTITYEGSKPGGLQDVDQYYKRLEQILTISIEDWSRTVKSRNKSKDA